MNSVQIMGRLTKEPDVRMGQKKIARFTLAVKRDKENSDFINCVAFDKTADFAERYLRKGKRAIVEGRIQTGSYEKDGRKVYTTDVIANKVTAVDYEQVEYSQPKPQPQQMQMSPSMQNWDNNSYQIAGQMSNITPNYSQPKDDGLDFSGSSLDISMDDLPF